jgi:formiminotetrahydrofolate cyclodeaminase
MLDKTATIEEFLSATAAKQPVPGGGSVAALAGALAAAMGEMVVSYSVGKKGLSAHQDQLRESLVELTRARAVMLELMVEDQAAFEALTAARKACNNAGDKDATFAAALLACIRIPQAIGATAGAILELGERLVPIGNKFLLSDLAVCAELAMATVRCAAHNVRVNLADVSDRAERDRFDRAAEQMLAAAVVRMRKIIPAIQQRQAP